MSLKSLKQFCETNDLSHAPACAGGVVNYHTLWDSSDVVKDVLEPLAEAFRRLPVKALEVPHIGIREGHHQVLYHDTTTTHVHIAFTKVCLTFAGMPNQFLCSVSLPAFCLPFRHIPAYRSVAARKRWVFLDQAIIDPFGRVPLFVTVLLVFLQPDAYGGDPRGQFAA